MDLTTDAFGNYQKHFLDNCTHGNRTSDHLFPTIGTLLPGHRKQTCVIYLFTLVGILGSAVCVVGLVGNALTLVVISKIGRGSVTFRILGVLAVVDMIYLLGYIVTQSVPEIINFWNPGMSLEYGTPTVWAIFPIYTMAQTASIWITTLVTTYRYMLARKLFKKSKVCSMTSVHFQLSLIVTTSIILGIPRYFERYPERIDENHTAILKPTWLWEDFWYQLIYRNIIMLFLRRLLPIFLTITLVYKRLQLLDTWKKFRFKMFNKTSLPDGQERISLVLVILAIIFVICQIPASLYPIARLFMEDTGYKCDDIYLYFFTLADFLLTLNSAFNFFIFYPSIPVFREVLRYIFCARKSSERPAFISQTSVVSARSERTRTLSTVIWQTIHLYVVLCSKG